MNTNKLTVEQIKNKYFKNELKITNDLDIPNVGKIDEYLKTLSVKDRKEFKEKVFQKAIIDLFPENQKAIFNSRLRAKILNTSQLEVAGRCLVCTSIFATVYNEWLTVDNKTLAECSRVATNIFDDKISISTFRRHLKYHIYDKELVRRAMVVRDGNIDPEKTGRGLLQLLTESIIRDDYMDLKKIKSAKELIKVLNDYEKLRMKKPAIDASITNITQINTTGKIPVAIGTQNLLLTPLTEDKQQRLKTLKSKWGGHGASRIRNQIPESPPVVKKQKSKVINALIKDDDDE